MKRSLSIVSMTVSLLGMPAHEARARDGLKSLESSIEALRYSVVNGILQATVAKEICSCRYVQGQSLKACVERINLPREALEYVDIQDLDSYQIVRVTHAPGFATFGLAAPKAEARFNQREPWKGCRLTYGLIESRQGQELR